MVFATLLFSRIILGGLELFNLHFNSGVHSQIWSILIDILKECWRTDNHTNTSYTREPAVTSQTAFNDWSNWSTKIFFLHPSLLPRLCSIQPSRKKQGYCLLQEQQKHQSLHTLFWASFNMLLQKSVNIWCRV